MKTFAILMLLFFGSIAHASEQTEKLFILTAFAAIDYHQSAGWVTPGGGATELNPILETHPTRANMLTFGVIGIGATWLATQVLPKSWGNIVLDSVISSEQWNIEDNNMAENGRRRLFQAAGESYNFRRINAVPVIITIRW